MNEVNSLSIKLHKCPRGNFERLLSHSSHEEHGELKWTNDEYQSLRESQLQEPFVF